MAMIFLTDIPARETILGLCERCGLRTKHLLMASEKIWSRLGLGQNRKAEFLFFWEVAVVRDCFLICLSGVMGGCRLEARKVLSLRK